MTNQIDTFESDGKYLLVNVLARRAKALVRGDRPTIPYAEGHFDPVDLAREELGSAKLVIRTRDKISGELEAFGTED